MANSYNSNPIIINTVMASGWKALQTLATKQVGPRVVQVMWTGATAQGHTFVIVDPIDSTILLEGQAGASLSDQLYVMNDTSLTWRDFKVSVITSGTLLITYH